MIESEFTEFTELKFVYIFAQITTRLHILSPFYYKLKLLQTLSLIQK